ncbi:hypothetical protein [Marinomonas profundimaris]|jgi:hypothetical protein|uniref:Uncharacterized protein n=1 Tax=Marinomonas profundimaris TaxID=1208321 RepID=W1RTN0_9GAMM|nr:hypothetical protein [Marinomonas profundimaris]ETI60347.1 hypothetical protein D104_09600 [Marinomonas profundimaris]
MKNNLIPFPKSRHRDNEKEVPLAPSDELTALRAAFDRARTDWVIELAELPENNKLRCGSKK